MNVLSLETLLPSSLLTDDFLVKSELTSLTAEPDSPAPCDDFIALFVVSVDSAVEPAAPSSELFSTLLFSGIVAIAAVE